MDDGEEFAAEESLRDDLEAAFNEEPGQPRDELGRFANNEDEAPEISEVPEIPEVPEEPPIDMPTSWSKEHGESWGTLPRNIQELVVDREKEQLADYTRKTQEISDFRRTYDEIRPALDHVAPLLQQSGISHGDYIGRLVSADQMLRDNPADFIRQAAQAYNIDLSALSEGEQGQPDPQFQTLQDQVNNMQRMLHQQNQTAVQQEQQAILTQIEEFSSTTDENGNPKYPHFETVNDVMAQLIQAGAAQGLEDAYEKAVWGNPEIRQSILDQQEADRKAALEKEQAEKVAQAKNASKSVTGAPANGASTGQPPAGSLREEISASFDAHS